MESKVYWDCSTSRIPELEKWTEPRLNKLAFPLRHGSWFTPYSFCKKGHFDLTADSTPSSYPSPFPALFALAFLTPSQNSLFHSFWDRATRGIAHRGSIGLSKGFHHSGFETSWNKWTINLLRWALFLTDDLRKQNFPLPEISSRCSLIHETGILEWTMVITTKMD